MWQARHLCQKAARKTVCALPADESINDSKNNDTESADNTAKANTWKSKIPKLPPTTSG